MLAVYRQVVCRPDCALQPCHALTYDNSRSTAAASVTPAEVMATKACWICSAGSSGSASNLRSIRCVLALSQYAVAKPVNVVAPYRHINEEMAPDFFRKFTGKTRPNNLISISVTISISASWFVGELSSYRWLMAFAALANGSLRRLAVRRKLADAHYHRRWCQSHAHCWRCGHAPARKPNLNLKQRPPRALFCLKLDNSCCYVHYSCGNNCNVVKLVQECKFFMHFISVLRKQFTENDTFLREANSYKRVLTLRNARMNLGLPKKFTAIAVVLSNVDARKSSVSSL